MDSADGLNQLSLARANTPEWGQLGSDHWNAQRDRCLKADLKQKSDDKVVQKPWVTTIFGAQVVNTY